METAAAMVLALLAVVVLINMVNGTLAAWLRAKFLHASATSTASPAAK